MTFKPFIKSFLTLQVLIAIIVTVFLTVLMMTKLPAQSSMPVAVKTQTTNTVREISMSDFRAPEDQRLYTPISSLLYTVPQDVTPLALASTALITGKIAAVPVVYPVKGTPRSQTMTDRTTVISTSMAYNMRLAYCDVQPKKCLDNDFAETP